MTLDCFLGLHGKTYLDPSSRPESNSNQFGLRYSIMIGTVWVSRNLLSSGTIERAKNTLFKKSTPFYPKENFFFLVLLRTSPPKKWGNAMRETEKKNR